MKQFPTPKIRFSALSPGLPAEGDGWLQEELVHALKNGDLNIYNSLLTMFKNIYIILKRVVYVKIDDTTKTNFNVPYVNLINLSLT